MNDYFNQKLKSIHENPVKVEIVNRAKYYKIVLLLIGQIVKDYRISYSHDIMIYTDYKY